MRKRSSEGRFKFRLFVAGEAPHSARAKENLHTICVDHGAKEYDLEVVDVLSDPTRALGEGVFVTPTLVVLAPGPPRKIIGDLSDASVVLSVLGAARSDEELA